MAQAFYVRNPYPVPDVSREGAWVPRGPVLGDKVSPSDRDWNSKLSAHERLFAHHTLNSIRRDHRFVRRKVCRAAFSAGEMFRDVPYNFRWIRLNTRLTASAGAGRRPRFRAGLRVRAQPRHSGAKDVRGYATGDARERDMARVAKRDQGTCRVAPSARDVEAPREAPLCQIDRFDMVIFRSRRNRLSRTGRCM